MGGASIRIEGLHELVEGLAKESALAQDRGAQAVSKTAERIESTAKNLAPKGGDSRGRGPYRPPLAPSIESTKIGETSWEVGPTALHGLFMEFGTYKDAPQPFMGPAADQHDDDLVRELERLVGEL